MRSVSSRPGWTTAQDSRDLGYLASLREMGRVSKKRKEGREEKNNTREKIKEKPLLFLADVLVTPCLLYLPSDMVCSTPAGKKSEVEMSAVWLQGLVIGKGKHFIEIVKIPLQRSLSFKRELICCCLLTEVFCPAWTFSC